MVSLGYFHIDVLQTALTSDLSSLGGLLKPLCSPIVLAAKSQTSEVAMRIIHLLNINPCTASLGIRTSMQDKSIFH